MEDAHSKSGRGLQATLTAASPFAAAASRAAPIRAALPTNLGLGGHLNSLPQPDSGHGHVQHSYVEALVDYLCPGLPSHARHQILSRFPAKCMEVQTPSAGVRHDLLSSNIGCDTPGMICGLTREEALVFAIVRFDDDSLQFSESLSYIASHTPPNRVSITVPPLYNELGSMVPAAWLRPGEPNELCLVYSRDDKHETQPHLHFCCMQMAQRLPSRLMYNVRVAMMEQSVYSNVVESKGGVRRSYHCFGLRPCFLASGGIGMYCLDQSKCQGLTAAELAAMQQSWFSSYDAMHRHMLNSLTKVNEALAVSQLSHLKAHHLNSNGIRLLHGWASTLFNSSIHFWKEPHIEEERDSFQSLGWYLQMLPKTSLPAVGELIQVEVQEPSTIDGTDVVLWKTAKVVKHLSKLSFKVCINDEADFLQSMHLRQEGVEWQRVPNHPEVRELMHCPPQLSNEVLLQPTLCAHVLSLLGEADPDSLLAAGAVCSAWRRCFYPGRFVSYASGTCTERVCGRWMLMRGEDCHGTEAGPTYQPPNSLCVPVLGVLAHTAKQVVCRSHSSDRRRTQGDRKQSERNGGTDSAHGNGLGRTAAGPVVATIRGESLDYLSTERVAKILNHHVYGGAKAGSLHNVYVRVRFLDGSTSGRVYFPAETIAGSAVLSKYVESSSGKALRKYCIPPLDM